MKININKTILGRLLAFVIIYHIFNRLSAIPNVAAMDNGEDGSKDIKKVQPSAPVEENLRSYKTVGDLSDLNKQETASVKESDKGSETGTPRQIPTIRVEEIKDEENEVPKQALEPQPKEDVEEQEAFEESQQLKEHDQQAKESPEQHTQNEPKHADEANLTQQKEFENEDEEMDQVSAIDSSTDEASNEPEPIEESSTGPTDAQSSHEAEQVDTEQNEDLAKIEVDLPGEEPTQQEAESFDEEVKEVLKELEQSFEGELDIEGGLELRIEDLDPESEAEEQAPQSQTEQPQEKEVSIQEELQQAQHQQHQEPQQQSQEESQNPQPEDEADQLTKSSKKVALDKFKSAVRRARLIDSMRQPSFMGGESSKIAHDRMAPVVVEEVKVKGFSFYNYPQQGTDIQTQQPTSQGSTESCEIVSDCVRDCCSCRAARANSAVKKTQDKKDSTKEVYSIHRNNIIDGPEEMIYAVLGFNFKIMRSPAVLLNLWPMEFGLTQPIVKVMNMELVDAENLIGSYYKIDIRGEDSSTFIPLLINKNAGDEIMKLMERKKELEEKIKIELPQIKTPRKVRKMDLVEMPNVVDQLKPVYETDREYCRVKRHLFDLDDADEESEIIQFCRAQYKTFGSIDMDNRSTERTTPESDMSSITRSGSSCGVGIVVGEFSDEDMGHLAALSEDVPAAEVETEM